MEEIKKLKKLPVIGRVQHGEQLLINGKKRVKEYGHFIAKIKEENMKPYLEKFNKIFKEAKNIDIKLVGDNPLSIRQERYNQGGAVCYCLENQTTGRQKVKNLWQPIECKSDCSYRQKGENGKSLCNRIAWLKFLIPEIANDRIWLMKITGQQSIDNLKAYIEFQQTQGNSLNNMYTIFLQQKEQINFNGDTFNNYILDIILKDEFISKKSIPETPKKQSENTSSLTSDKVTNSIVEKRVASTSSTDNIKPKESLIDNQKEDEKKTTNTTNTAESKGKEKASKKAKTDNESNQKNQQETTIDEYKDCYVLLGTHQEKILDKDYLVGEFTDMNDQVSNIYIHPNFKDELLECELGSVMKLGLQEVKNKKFAVNIEFVEKHMKKIAA